MAEENKTEIKPISDETKGAIRRKTAETLPDNPTAAGMKADEIKAAFFKGLSDGDFSVLAEIERVITEANSILVFLKKKNDDLSYEVFGLKNALGGKLDRQSGNDLYRTVYAEGTDGSTEMIQVRSSAAKDAIVAYGDDYRFKVAAPTIGGHPVNKVYFDTKSNNSLYSEVTDMERRVKALEHSASGNVYETKRVKGNAAVIQVDNACAYGILSRVGGNVARVTVGMPFNLSGATVFKNNSAYGKCTAKENAVIFHKGGTYGVQFPCVLPAGATVTVDAVSTAFDSRDRISHYILLDANGSAVSSQGVINTSVAVPSGKTAAYILLYKENKTTELYDDLEISDVRVILNTPSDGNLTRAIDEIAVSEEIRSLAGYGEEGAYIDLTERRFYDADGAATDVSAYLNEESDVISLLPSALLEFTDVDGNRVNADYELSYKNKI